MMETKACFVEYKTERGMAVLELNNPPANAYHHELMRELDEAILKARLDDNVHVLVLTGKGDKCFCAGADISLLQSKSSSFRYHFALHANETFMRLENTPKLVIAAINGHCLGGGLEMALACDLRIAKKGGGKIGLPEIALGVLPGTGGTQRLPRLIGRSKALELMIKGESLTMEEAHSIGIVNHLVEGENFREKVLEYASQFLPPAKAAKAAGLIKRAVVSGSDGSLGEGLALERELLQQLFDSQDAKEGLSSYLEKRKPNFSGR
jgi:enoyl-CoA hydratase/carnithine racemase